jgi:hypothetical protein
LCAELEYVKISYTRPIQGTASRGWTGKLDHKCPDGRNIRDGSERHPVAPTGTVFLLCDESMNVDERLSGTTTRLSLRHRCAAISQLLRRLKQQLFVMKKKARDAQQCGSNIGFLLWRRGDVSI